MNTQFKATRLSLLLLLTMTISVGCKTESNLNITPPAKGSFDYMTLVGTYKGSCHVIKAPKEMKDKTGMHIEVTASESQHYLFSQLLSDSDKFPQDVTGFGLPGFGFTYINQGEHPFNGPFGGYGGEGEPAPGATPPPNFFPNCPDSDEERPVWSTQAYTSANGLYQQFLSNYCKESEVVPSSVVTSLEKTNTGFIFLEKYKNQFYIKPSNCSPYACGALGPDSVQYISYSMRCEFTKD